jgi:hypothetical protein
MEWTKVPAPTLDASVRSRDTDDAKHLKHDSLKPD